MVSKLQYRLKNQKKLLKKNYLKIRNQTQLKLKHNQHNNRKLYQWFQWKHSFSISNNFIRRKQKSEIWLVKTQQNKEILVFAYIWEIIL